MMEACCKRRERCSVCSMRGLFIQPPYSHSVCVDVMLEPVTALRVQLWVAKPRGRWGQDPLQWSGTGLHECTDLHPVYLQPSSHSPGLHFPTLLPGDLLDPCPWLFPWTPSSLAFAGLRCSRVPSMSPLPACSLGWKAGIFPSIHPSILPSHNLHRSPFILRFMINSASTFHIH